MGYDVRRELKVEARVFFRQKREFKRHIPSALMASITFISRMLA